MRHLLYLLVVLNLLLLLWIYQFDEQLPPQQGGRAPLGELRIVSEEALQRAKWREQQATGEDLQQPPRERQVQHAGEGAAGTAEDLCTSVGPLASSRQAAALAARLATMQQQAAIRSEAVLKKTYEVMLPPLESRFAATRKLQELQRSGIEGAQQIRSGKYSKGITFGVFHYRDDAQRRLLGVLSFADHAEIATHTERRELYWVDIDARLQEKLSAQQLATLREQFSGIEIHEVSCGQQQ
jgi:hypothetical protein